MNATFRISLDIHRIGSQVSVTAFKGDSAYTIIASLTERGKPYQIKDGCKAIFTAVRPKVDDTELPLFNECEVVNNTIVYDFRKTMDDDDEICQTTAVVGETVCQFKIMDESGAVLASPIFTLVVNDTVYDGPESADIVPEYTALTEYLANLEQKVNKGDFNGADGKDGANGKDGADGKDGEDGEDGVSATHSWNGTVLTITSASGTSSADLKGEKGDNYILTEADKSEIAEKTIKNVATLPTASADTVGKLYKCDDIVYLGTAKEVLGTSYIEVNTSGLLETDLRPLPCRYTDVVTLTKNLDKLGKVAIIEVNYDGTHTEMITARSWGISTPGDVWSSANYTLSEWVNGDVDLYDYYLGCGYSGATYTLTPEGISLMSGQTINTEYALSPVATTDNIKGGDGGVYVGSGDMPEGYNVQIDPNGEAYELPNDYELIEVITTTEALTRIERSQEPNGEDYKFTGLFMRFIVPQVTTTINLRMLINQAFMVQIANGVNASWDAHSVAELVYIPSLNTYKYVCTQNTNSFHNAANTMTSWFANEVSPIRNVAIYTANNTELPIGTKIEIYGVRANEN